jgi:hypothetical protein
MVNQQCLMGSDETAENNSGLRQPAAVLANVLIG